MLRSVPVVTRMPECRQGVDWYVDSLYVFMV
jgi:hypothetical protein